jgi:hypothetical protein
MKRMTILLSRTVPLATDRRAMHGHAIHCRDEARILSKTFVGLQMKKRLD